MQARLLLVFSALVSTIACAGNSPISPSSGGPLPSLEGFSAPSEVASVLQVQSAAPRPRKVTSGTIATAVASLSGSVTLRGARFEITGDWADGGSNGCQPCSSGPATIRTAASFAGTRGAATVDGVRYNSVYLSGTIPMTGTATIPTSDAPALAVEYPFVIDDSSLLIGYATNPLVGQAQELFRLDLRGGGTATIELVAVQIPYAPAVYTARSLKYTF